MRTLRLFTAAMLAMMLMQMQAQKKSNVLYESPNYVIGTETPTWDETLQKNVIKVRPTENGWVGGNKIVNATDVNIVDDTSVLSKNVQESLKQGDIWKNQNKDSKNRLTTIFWRLTEEKNQTLLHCYFLMAADVMTGMWLGGAETYIVDQETGIHYKARKATPDVLGTHFTVNAPEGSLIDLTIAFPPLPKTTRKIAIYGLPSWMEWGQNVVTLPKRGAGKKSEYDAVPKLRVPRLVKDPENYDKDNHQSWPCVTNVHTIKPLKSEQIYALWRTPEATYMAIPRNHNWNREYYGIDDTIFLIDNNGNRYKIKSVQGFPLNKIVWVEETAGDWWAQVLVFEPLPLDVNTIHYIVPDGKPFKAWGANWKGKQVTDLDVEELRDNQRYFEYFERVVVE